MKKISFKKKEKTVKSKVVTQGNLEESRAEILAKGKKFKYPFQYAKHRLVINTIAIGLVAFICFVVVGWVELYKVQSTSEVTFRFTKVLPVYVAKIDGVKVRYSDYLMLYRSSVNSVEYQQGEFDDSQESELQKYYYRRQAMNSAEEYSYALDKIEEAGKGVTEEEIDAVVNDHRMINGEERSEEAFRGIVRDNFGLSMSEYRHLIKLSLAKKKYSELFDETANKEVEKIKKALEENQNDFDKVMEAYSKSEIVSLETVKSVDINNLDAGRAITASKLKEAGNVSSFFTSKNGDGYYIVKLLSKGDDRVSYQSIFVRFTEFDKMISKIREEDKVKEYIKLKEPDSGEAETAETEEAEESEE